MNSHPLNRDTLVKVFFFAAFSLILYQLFLMAKPFFSAMLGAAVLAMIFYPLHRRNLRFLQRENLAAFLSTLGVLLLAVLPLVWIAWFFIRETAELAPTAQNLLEDLRSHDWPSLSARLPPLLQKAAHYMAGLFSRLNIDIKQIVMDNAQVIGVQATGWATGLLRNIIISLLNILILAVALFFAFRDGEALLAWALSLIPMQATHKKIVEKRVFETFKAVVIGSFVTAAIQGATAMIGFLFAGVRLPVILGLATSMGSMLGSSAIITLPVALSVMKERTGAGIFLLVWSLGVVGLLDNFVKPILIGSRAQMPFILIFFSIVGGIKLYGFLGFFLGPMLVASFLSFVKIYREEYN